jgi:hypothetical protein
VHIVPSNKRDAHYIKGCIPIIKMKSIFLLGSATLAAGAGITIEVEKIAVAGITIDPEFGGCVANTVITSEEQCYAAALALRSAGELGADTIDHTNAPFPQLHPDHPTGGWATLPKGCSTWYDTQIHWNEGSGAGTGTLADNVRNSICLVHDPEVQHKAVGVNCKERERIHGAEQCAAAAAELGISGTDAQVVTAADRPQGCSSDNVGLYWNDGDGSNWNSYWNDGGGISSDHQAQAICTSGKLWKSANELADASCDELSQEYRDDTCCTNCVA